LFISDSLHKNKSFSEKFFKHINSLDTKIMIIGEKTVKYSGEYAILGKNKVYSLYDEYIKNMEDKVTLFLQEIETIVNNLKEI
jgi:hypothetical protein